MKIENIEEIKKKIKKYEIAQNFLRDIKRYKDKINFKGSADQLETNNFQFDLILYLECIIKFLKTTNYSEYWQIVNGTINIIYENIYMVEKYIADYISKFDEEIKEL